MLIKFVTTVNEENYEDYTNKYVENIDSFVHSVFSKMAFVLSIGYMGLFWFFIMNQDMDKKLLLFVLIVPPLLFYWFAYRPHITIVNKLLSQTEDSSFFLNSLIGMSSRMKINSIDVFNAHNPVNRKSKSNLILVLSVTDLENGKEDIIDLDFTKYKTYIITDNNDSEIYIDLNEQCIFLSQNYINNNNFNNITDHVKFSVFNGSVGQK